MPPSRRRAAAAPPPHRRRGTRCARMSAAGGTGPARAHTRHARSTRRVSVPSRLLAAWGVESIRRREVAACPWSRCCSRGAEGSGGARLHGGAGGAGVGPQAQKARGGGRPEPGTTGVAQQRRLLVEPSGPTLSSASLRWQPRFWRAWSVVPHEALARASRRGPSAAREREKRARGPPPSRALCAQGRTAVVALCVASARETHAERERKAEVR